MKLSSLTPVAAVLAVSLTAVAHAETSSNPFVAKPLSTIVVAGNHEGKCGEGKCGGDKAAKAKEGKCGEGKCGEGKCGGAKGKTMSKEDFMKKHDAMFDKADSNQDGMLDAKEHKALHRAMKKSMKAHKEGKCGEGKCGSSKK